jgi:nitrile hydratase
MERAVHDRGGWPTDAPIDRAEHELADWEMLMDSIVGTLGARGVMNVDELRRGIESMGPADYEAASYYERWLFATETILAEKGVLSPGELDEQVAR